MKIWCLFSVDNNYDQPPNNLVCWWKEKPTIEQVAGGMSIAFPSKEDEKTLAVVNVWGGKGARDFNTDYRLEEIDEGIL